MTNYLSKFYEVSALFTSASDFALQYFNESCNIIYSGTLLKSNFWAKGNMSKQLYVRSSPKKRVARNCVEMDTGGTEHHAQAI